MIEKMRHKENVPVGREGEYQQAQQFFNELKGYRISATPAVSRLELSVAANISDVTLSTLEKGNPNRAVTSRLTMTYAEKIIGAAVLIENKSEYLQQLADERRKDREKRDPVKNKEAQARWRERHPELELERQRTKREKRRTGVNAA